VEVVAGNHYELGDRFDKLTVIGMHIKKRGKCWKPDHYGVFVLSSATLFDAGKFVSLPGCGRDAWNHGDLFIYLFHTFFLAIDIIQKTNNPFPGVIFQ